jgi:hypothetical protein
MVKSKALLSNTDKDGGSILFVDKAGKESKVLEVVAEGKDMAQSIGKLMYELGEICRAGGIKVPGISINGVELTPAQAAKFKKSFIDFRFEFPAIREMLLANLAFASDETKTEYIRRTDRNGVFTKQKTFTEQQVAAQAKEQLRLTRDLSRWVKVDAQDSVVPAEVAQRRLLNAEVAKQKRIEAKTAAKAVVATVGTAAPVPAKATA